MRRKNFLKKESPPESELPDLPKKEPEREIQVISDSQYIEHKLTLIMEKIVSIEERITRAMEE